MTSVNLPRSTTVVAYTCSLGGADYVRAMLKCGPQTCENLRLVMFTDRDDASLPKRRGNWTVLPALTRFDVVRAMGYDWGAVTPQRLSRMHKLLPHLLPAVNDADVSIWFDGNIIPRSGIALTDLVRYVTAECPLATFRHPTRGSIEEEVRACIRFRKDRRTTMRSQLAGYVQEGFSANAGLAGTGVLVRRNMPAIRQFCEEWAFEVLTKSVRDQISFPYVSWRLEQSWTALPGEVFENEWFTYRPHKRISKVSKTRPRPRQRRPGA